MLSGVVCGATATGGRSTPRRRLLVAYAALALTCSALWAVHCRR